MKFGLFLGLSLSLAGCLLLAGCPGKSSPSSASNPGPTDSFTPTPTPTSTPNATATYQAQETATQQALFVATHEAKATATAQQAATAAQQASETATGQPTATFTPLLTSTPTQTPTPYPTTAWSFYAPLGLSYATATPAAAPGSDGYFEEPLGVAAGDGYLAVGDNGYKNIQVFNSAGTYLYSVTPHGASPDLGGMALDSNGELYVADYDDAEVDGYLLGSSSYTYDYTWTAQGGMASPFCVKIDAKGNLVVGDIGTNSVWNLAWADDTVLSETTIGAVPNMDPFDLALDQSGNIYVSDEGNNQVDVFNSQYAFTGSFTGSSWTPALAVPNGIGVDSQGNLFISDPDNARVVYTTAQGTYLGEINGFNYPTFLALDGSDDLFVTDTGSGQVDEFTQ